MTGAEIDCSKLARLVEQLADAPEVIRAAKRKAFEDAAPKMKAAVDEGIGGTGKVKSWQEQVVGSKGGYAAVRPRASTFTEPNGRGKVYAVGHVSNAIDKGHKFPNQAGKTKAYNTASGKQMVKGKDFYGKAEGKVKQIAQEAVEQVEAELLKHLEG